MASAQGMLSRLPRLSIGHATLASIGVDGTLAVGSIVTTPYLVHHIGAEPYGILAMVSVLAGQLGVLHLGIGPAATRRIAEARGRGETERHAAILWATAALSLLAALLVAAAFLVLAPWAWRERFHGSASVVLQALAAMTPAAIVVAGQPLLAAVAGGLTGEERFAAFNAWRLAHGLGRMTAAVAVVFAGGGAGSVLWAHAAVDVLAVTAGFLSWPHPGGRVHWESLRAAARDLLSLGLPFAGAGLMAALLLDTEKLAVSMARSIEDFTYYTVPFNAVIRLTMFAGALSTVLFPRLASVAAGGDLVRARDLVRRATRLSVASMSLMLAPLVAVAPELLHVWLGPTFAERSSRPMRILLVALVANTAAYAYNSAIRARARPSALTWLYAAELPLHLAAVYLLVRAWGTTGAALAWAARATVDLAGHYRIAGRTLGERAGGAASLVGPMAALGAFAFACEALGPAMPLGLRVMIGVLLGLGTASLVLTAEDRTVALQALGPLSRRRGEGA